MTRMTDPRECVVVAWDEVGGEAVTLPMTLDREAGVFDLLRAINRGLEENGDGPDEDFPFPCILWSHDDRGAGNVTMILSRDERGHRQTTQVIWS